jgi:lysophospholipase L1-like esterase
MWLEGLLLGVTLGGATTAEPATQAATRYLALGDSYTIGEGVPESARWPVVLAQRLRAQGHAVDAPQIVAHTGWTTDELAAALERAPLAPPYDLVSLLIGVNNQYRGRAADDYRREFARLLARAIELAGARPQRVFVVSIPDWGVTPFAEGRDRARIGREIDAFNAIAQDEARRHGVAYVDVTPISRASGQPAEFLAADGLHPGPAQYRRWAEQALPVAAGLLAR